MSRSEHIHNIFVGVQYTIDTRLDFPVVIQLDDAKGTAELKLVHCNMVTQFKVIYTQEHICDALQ